MMDHLNQCSVTNYQCKDLILLNVNTHNHMLLLRGMPIRKAHTKMLGVDCVRPLLTDQ